MPKQIRIGWLLAALFAVSPLFYAQRVLIPFQESDARLHHRPRGILSDIYPRWLGARELLLHHRDPYSPEITREIQTGYYGRPLDPNRPDDPKDEERFAYPVYVVFVLAPTISLPFATVRVAAGWVLEIVSVAGIFLWLRVLGWRPRTATLGILLLMIMASYPAIQGIKLQQLSLLVCALVAAAAALLVSGHLVVAGILLAVATIKPQLVVLVAAWLLFWAINRWRERQRFFWSFLGTCGVLVVAGEFVLPGWIGRFREAIVAYRRYTGGGSPLDALTNHVVGVLLAALVVLTSAAVCWRWRRAPANSAEFHLVLAIVLTVTLTVAPMLAPYNQLLLVPAILLIVRSWDILWRRSLACRTACSAAAVFVLWPWVVSSGLVLASLVMPPSTIQRAWAVPLWTLPATSIALLGPLAFLYIDLSASLAKAAG